MSQCTEAEVRRMLPLVSEQRRETALKYKHLFGQWASLKSWLMWKSLVVGHWSLVDGQRSLEWKYNEYGKPYMEGGLEFSLSHCKYGIAVAVDDKPIGIDIESIREFRPELVERTMNAFEQSAISNQQSEVERAVEFTRLWTQKEAYLKYLGTGITDDLRHVLDNTGNAQFETTIKTNYIYTICHEKN